MNKAAIIRQLNTFIDSLKNNADKKTQKKITALQRVREETLIIGDQPKYFCARMECNSTGVGESSYEGTKTKRTVALDYVTDEYLFIDGNEHAAKKGLELFHLKPGETINYFRKDEMEKVAKREGFARHSQYFRDLNFYISDHRLNRCTTTITKKPFTYPIRPVTALLSEKGEKILIGYIYRANGEEFILIEPQDIENPQGDGFSFKPWLIVALFCPFLLLLIPIIWLIKEQKERMVG